MVSLLSVSHSWKGHIVSQTGENYPPPPGGGFQEGQGGYQGQGGSQSQGGHQGQGAYQAGQGGGYPAPPPGQGGYPAQGPGQYGYGGAPMGRPRNGLGIAALVLGILALLTGFFLLGGLLGIIAIILGFIGRGRAKRGEATNGGMALAGIITGLLGLLITIGIIAAGVSVFNSKAGKDLQSCLKSAGSDQSAVQSCQDKFSKQITK